MTLVLVLLSAAACGAGGPSAADTSGSTSAVPGITGTTAPGTTDTTSPEPTGPPVEGTGAESPQAASTKRFVQVTAPLDGASAPTFTADFPTGCVGFFLVDALTEDATVAGVTVGPENGYVRDDGACDGGDRCDGFVYRTGTDGCVLGIRWKPESGVRKGQATVRITAVCRSRDDVLCDDLDDPPAFGGTAVEASATRFLTAGIDEPDVEISPTGRTSPSGDATTEPTTEPTTSDGEG